MQVDTLNISYINVSSSNICNISTSYVSAYTVSANVLTTGSFTTNLINMKSIYDSPGIAFSTSADGIMGRMGGDYNTSTFDLTVYPFNISYFNITAPDTYVNVSSLNICNVQWFTCSKVWI
jgi:flagellar basal body rod protein FlgC